MKQKCIDAVTALAKSLKKEGFGKKELNTIETDIRAAYVELDSPEFKAKSALDQGKDVQKHVANLLEKRAAHNEYKALKQITKHIESRQIMLAAAEKSKSPVMKVLTNMVATLYDYRSGVMSTEHQQKHVANTYLEEMRGLFDIENKGLLGGIATNEQVQLAVVSELSGRPSGIPEIAAEAKKIRAMLDKLSDDYVAAGGSLGYLKDWMPQQLDSARLMGGVFRTRSIVSQRNKFVDFMMNHIDRKKYFETNGTYLSDDGMKKFLSEAFNTISSEGYNKIVGGKLTTAVKHNIEQHRQLFYKDADSYMAVMKQYGQGNISDAIHSHVSSVAGEMRMMDKFGPDWVDTIGRLQKEAHETDLANNLDPTPGAKKLDQIMRLVTGVGHEVANPRLHQFVNNIQSVNVFAHLGSLLTAQLSDNATAISVTRSLGNSLPDWAAFKANFYSSDEMRSFCRAAAVSFEMAIAKNSRFMDATTSKNVLSKLADATMKFSAANHFTSIHREAVATFTLSFMSDLTRKYDWNTLDVDTKARLEGAGFTETDYAIMKAANPVKVDKYDMVSHKEIADIPLETIRSLVPSLEKDFIAKAKEIKRQEFDLQEKTEVVLSDKDLAGVNKMVDDAAIKLANETGLKLSAFAIQNAELAVTQPSLYTKAVLAPQLGTVTGELGRAFVGFKMFPTAIWIQHLQQAANMPGTSPWMYRGKVAVLSALFGGMGVLLDDIVSGKDPRKVWKDGDPKVLAKFGVAALAKGGGTPFLSDWVQQAMQDSKDPVRKIAGPTIGKLLDVGTLISEVGKYALTDANTHVAKKALDVAKAWTPMQNLIWTKALFHNFMMAELYEMASPGYKDGMNSWSRKNTGGDYWLGMGNERAPNMDIIGE